MKDKISRAKVIKKFIDRIQFNNNNTSMLAAIAAGYDLKVNSSSLSYLLSVQQENFERLLLEIELADIEQDAKSGYKAQVKQLSRLVEYPVLQQKPDVTHRDVVAPNIQALAYVSDKLAIYSEIDVEQKEELSQFVQELQIYSKSILESQLDIRLKVLISSTLNNLVLLLQNYSVFGFDRANEVAAAAMTAIYKAAPVASAEDRKLLQKIAAVSMMVVGALATVDTGMKHAGSIVGQAKSAYEFVEKSLEEYRPRIEYKKDKEEKQ